MVPVHSEEAEAPGSSLVSAAMNEYSWPQLGLDGT